MLFDIKIIVIERIVVFVVASVIHVALMFGVVIESDSFIKEEAPAREIKLVTIQEEVPPPLPRVLPQIPNPTPPEPLEQVEAPIPDTILESEDAPEQEPRTPTDGSLNSPLTERRGTNADEFVNQAKLDDMPLFDTKQLKARAADLYPPIARNSNLVGTVILELYVDSHGEIRHIEVLKEDPPDWGFAEAALQAFEGMKALSPAASGGKAVGARYRYPMRFTLR